MPDEIRIDNPGGLGFRIDRLWAFVSVHGDGDEGVVAVKMNNSWMPLVAADEKRLEDLMPWAVQMANLSEVPIRLARFDVRTDLQLIEPTKVKK